MACSSRPHPQDQSSAKHDSKREESAPQPDAPAETKAAKRVRLAREREQRAKERELEKQQKAQEREANRQAKIQERLDAGESMKDIKAEEEMKELTTKAVQQWRRYTTVSVKANLPLNGIAKKEKAWMFLKDWTPKTVSDRGNVRPVQHLAFAKVSEASRGSRTARKYSDAAMSATSDFRVCTRACD